MKLTEDELEIIEAKRAKEKEAVEFAKGARDRAIVVARDLILKQKEKAEAHSAKVMEILTNFYNKLYKVNPNYELVIEEETVALEVSVYDYDSNGNRIDYVDADGNAVGYHADAIYARRKVVDTIDRITYNCKIIHNDDKTMYIDLNTRGNYSSAWCMRPHVNNWTVSNRIYKNVKTVNTLIIDAIEHKKRVAEHDLKRADSFERLKKSFEEFKETFSEYEIVGGQNNCNMVLPNGFEISITHKENEDGTFTFMPHEATLKFDFDNVSMGDVIKQLNFVAK